MATTHRMATRRRAADDRTAAAPSGWIRTSSPARRRPCSPCPATSPSSSPRTTASACGRWRCAGIDLTTGRVDVVPVPCGSRWEDRCRPCADKNRRLRMAQCREGWHLDRRTHRRRRREPTERQKQLHGHPRRPARRLPGRREPRTTTDECEQIRETVAELDHELRGARRPRPARPARPEPPRQQALHPAAAGRAEPAPPPGRAAHRRAGLRGGRTGPRRSSRSPWTPTGGWTATAPRSTRTATTTAGPPGTRSTSRSSWTGSGRTSAAAWAGTSSTSAPSNRNAAAPRTSTPPSAAPSPAPSCGRSPPPPTTRCGGPPTTRSATPAIGCRCGTTTRKGSSTPTPASRCRPSTRPPTQLTEPAHVVRFGPQVHVKGILGGTEEAGRHIGYLTKYLTKSVARPPGSATTPTDRQREHRRRLRRRAAAHPVLAAVPDLAALRHPAQGPPHRRCPGLCKGKAHKPEHLGIAGRRVLVSRKWSNKTLDDHHAERDRVRSATPDQGRRPARLRRRRRTLRLGEDPARRPRRPHPTGPAAARDQPAAALESRLPRRPARGRRTTRNPFGNRDHAAWRP